MFEDVLELYLEELRKFQKLSMDEEAKLHCMGILKGIYKFEIDATTEFKDFLEMILTYISHRFLRSGRKGIRITTI